MRAMRPPRPTRCWQKTEASPDGEQFEEQRPAIPVHHADRVEGHRRMHTAVRGQRGTEEMPEAMVEARGLFDALITEQSADSGRHRQQFPDDHRHTPWLAAATTRREVARNDVRPRMRTAAHVSCHRPGRASTEGAPHTSGPSSSVADRTPPSYRPVDRRRCPALTDDDGAGL